MNRQVLRNFYSLFALIILMIGLTIIYPDFLSPTNLSNLAKQVTINGILGIGMTMVIISSGIDLSVGSLVAFSGMIVGILQVKLGWNGQEDLLLTFATCFAAIGATAGLGAINGTLISRTNIPPFIITLGMMQIARGLTQIFLNSTALSPMGEQIKYLNRGIISFEISLALFLVWLGFIIFYWWKDKRQWFTFLFRLLATAFTAYAFLNSRGIPIPILFLVASAVLVQFLLTKVPFGRYIYAIGGNEQASYLSGLPVRRTKFAVYTLMGALSGVAGILMASRINSAEPNAGQMGELDAIAAVVIGGTSLMGGKGRLAGTIVGAMIISTINNGMSLMGIDSIYQMVIKGVILILAVWMDSRR